MFNFYASVWGRDRSNYSSDNILLGTYNAPRPPHFYHGRVGVRGHFPALFLPFSFLSFLRISLICMPESEERDRSNYSSRHILLGTPTSAFLSRGRRAGTFFSLFLPLSFSCLLCFKKLPDTGGGNRSNYSSCNILLGTSSTPRPPRFCHWGYRWRAQRVGTHAGHIGRPYGIG
jgi:hypothetical protein